jgi:hypothetical protein
MGFTSPDESALLPHQSCETLVRPPLPSPVRPMASTLKAGHFLNILGMGWDGMVNV